MAFRRYASLYLVIRSIAIVYCKMVPKYTYRVVQNYRDNGLQ
jgi:hypothetical protein